jgi:hypothetical protein
MLHTAIEAQTQSMTILNISKPATPRGTVWCEIADSAIPPGVKHRRVTYIANQQIESCSITDGLEELFDRWGHLCDSPAEICEEIETAKDAAATALVLSFYPNHYLNELQRATTGP